jgi:hypothetical protein
METPQSDTLRTLHWQPRACGDVGRARTSMCILLTATRRRMTWPAAEIRHARVIASAGQ